MGRKPRLFVAGYPYHIVQRGNNRSDIFRVERDYCYFLNILQDAKRKHRCQIFSYCLMTNHVHLMLCPEDDGSISRFMKLVAAKYAHFANRMYERTGTLWEGRFRDALVQGESYFLRCSRYIENNPVRAGIVAAPGEYRWSSYRAWARGEPDALVDPSPWYEGLGNDARERQNAYQEFFVLADRDADAGVIRKETARGGVVGTDSFKAQFDPLVQTRVCRPPGRPPR